MAALSASYSAPLTSDEEKIHALSLATLVRQCRSGALGPSDVMRAYAKKVFVAQKESNCVSDVLVEEALSSALSQWGPGQDTDSDRVCHQRPLLGVPISVKGGLSRRFFQRSLDVSRTV